jgi:hypothetical protein
MSRSQITKARDSDDGLDVSEAELSQWLRRCSRQGVLHEGEAALDVAFAQGYKKGIEEGRGDHEDAVRTLLLRVLEAKFGELDERTLDRIAEAQLGALEQWIVDAFGAHSMAEALGA